jgi:hypothetical protein
MAFPAFDAHFAAPEGADAEAALDYEEGADNNDGSNIDEEVRDGEEGEGGIEDGMQPLHTFFSSHDLPITWGNCFQRHPPREPNLLGGQPKIVGGGRSTFC